jgi:23S rRNA pseudouridine2604 synthase
MRINRALARVGVCSRRDADKLIDQGRILVNGQLPQKGSVIALDAKITLSREGSVSTVNLSKLHQKPRIWMHNKQKGMS